jgi:hypothetical protein
MVAGLAASAGAIGNMTAEAAKTMPHSERRAGRTRRPARMTFSANTRAVTV